MACHILNFFHLQIKVVLFLQVSLSVIRLPKASLAKLADKLDFEVDACHVSPDQVSISGPVKAAESAKMDFAVRGSLNEVVWILG